MFKFEEQRINYDNPLGKGRYGYVYPYQKNSCDIKWVVKHQSARNNELEQKIQEIALGFNLSHPNVLGIKGFHLSHNQVQRNWNIYLKMPRMVGSLKVFLDEHIKEQKSFTKVEIIRFLHNIASGLAYLHTKKIVHRDIKLANILVDEKNIAKISDVGSAALIEGETDSSVDRVADFLYAAPEVLDDNSRLAKKDFFLADAWGLGVTIAELCLLKSPAVTPFVSGAEKEKALTEQLNKVKAQYGEELISLIQSLLKNDPKRRKTVEQVLKALEESDAKEVKPDEEIDAEEVHAQDMHPGGINVEEAHVEEINVEEIHAQVINAEEIKFRQMSQIPKFVEVKKQVPQKLLRELEDSLTTIQNHLITKFTYQDKQLFSVRTFLGGQLELKVELFSQFSEEKLNQLLKELDLELGRECCTGLKILTLDLNSCEKLTGMAFSGLSKSQENIYLDPEELVIQLRGCHQINNDGFSNLAEYLGKKYNNLRSLTLDFKNCWQLNDDALNVLAEMIGINLKRLQRLTLHLDGPNIHNETVLYLFKEIGANVIGLEAFSLYFSNCSSITNNLLAHATETIKPYLRGIQWLTIGLSGTKIDSCKQIELKKLMSEGGHNVDIH